MLHRTPRSASERIALLVAIAVIAFFSACSDEGADETSFTIPSTSTLDGVASADSFSSEGRTDLEPRVGDGPFKEGGIGAKRFVAYYSFDLREIPAESVVVSATLSLYVHQTTGDPQGMMVLARIDHVDYDRVFPEEPLDATSLDVNFDQITDLTTVGRREIDVTTQVQADLDDGATRSQFGIRGAIASNFDNLSDAFFLTDAEDTSRTGELPLLFVEIE